LARRYPDQWLWVHKRWKTRPEGEIDPYSDPPGEDGKRTSIGIETKPSIHEQGEAAHL